MVGGYLLGKAQAFELLFTRILLHAIESLWGRWLAKFAQLILTITIAGFPHEIDSLLVKGARQEIG